MPTNLSYTYHASKAPSTIEKEGGSVKIIDPTVFPLASMVSAAIVTIHPGAIREIHWHTTSDEWNFFLEGSARISLYAAQGNAQTFDYHAGDCGYVRPHPSSLISFPYNSALTSKQIPIQYTHYVENIGTTDVKFIEVLAADHFSDISVGQWVGLTPPQIVIDTLNITNETVQAFSPTKQYIVQGDIPPMTGEAA